MKHLKNVKSHEQCRKSICVLCFSASKTLRKLTNSQVLLIRELVYSNFNLMDDRFPCVICARCRIEITRYCNKNDLEKSIKLFDCNEIFKQSKSITRSSIKNFCECKICKISRQSGLNYAPKQRIQRQTGRPRKIATISSSETQNSKLCGLCLNPISKGVSYKCSKKARQVNLRKIVYQTESKNPVKSKKLTLQPKAILMIYRIL